MVTELWVKPKKLFLRAKALCDTHLAQTVLTYPDSGSDLPSECRHSPEQEWAARWVLSARSLKQRNSLPYNSSKYQSNFLPLLDLCCQNFFQFIFRKKKTIIFARVVNSLLCCIYEVKNSMLSISELGNSYFSTFVLIIDRIVFLNSIGPSNSRRWIKIFFFNTYMFSD